MSRSSVWVCSPERAGWIPPLSFPLVVGMLALPVTVAHIQRSEMKLYYMPGACSIGIHVLLEKSANPYDPEDRWRRAEAAAGLREDQSEVQGADAPEGRRVGGLKFPRSPPGSRAERTRACCRPMPTARRACSRRWTMSCRPCTCRLLACSARQLCAHRVRPRQGQGARQEIMEGSRPHGQSSRRARSTSPASSRSPTRLSSTSSSGRPPHEDDLRRTAAHYERMKNRPAVKRTIEQEGLQQAFA